MTITIEKKLFEYLIAFLILLNKSNILWVYQP